MFHAVIGPRLVFCGLALDTAATRLVLNTRNRVQYGCTSLQTNLAYALAQLADIRPGMVVCDPMIGSGTCMIEALLAFPDAVYLGGDINEEELGAAEANRAALPPAKAALLSLFLWDATDLPLGRLAERRPSPRPLHPLTHFLRVRVFPHPSQRTRLWTSSSAMCPGANATALGGR